MDPEHSTPRPTTNTCTQTVNSSKQGGEVGSHRCLEQFTLETVEELESKVHEAISQKDMDLLKCLVHCHKAPLEERDEQGLTPLYNAVHKQWLDGAFFLLERGADVHNAESIPENLFFSHEPLMHLAVKTGSQRLVQELIKGGASIRVRDCGGETCVRWYHFSRPNILFEWLGNSVTEEGRRCTDLLKDLLFIVSTAAQNPQHLDRVEEFISRQPSCHQKRMLEVCGACVSSTRGKDHEMKALRYWKMSAKCLPCQLHDNTMEEEMARKSVFADILSVKEHPLPDTVTTDDDKLAVDIQALLVLERCMTEHIVLIDPGARLCTKLFSRGEIDTALGVLWRLTTIRPLYRDEVDTVRGFLQWALVRLKSTEELLFSDVMDSMKIIQNCLSSCNVSCSKVQPASDLEGERLLKSTCRHLFEGLLQIMNFCYGPDVPATPEQLEGFSSHIKEFLRCFPSAYCQNAFHLLAQSVFDHRMIKDLVTYSAEVRGTVRQDSPLHLLSDRNGDTPLHCIARHRSQEVLVQEGVLQCFLDNGADLCTRNNEGETVRSILVECGVYTEGELLPSLQCLAAAAFMGDRRLRQTVQNCRPAAVRNFLLAH